MNLLLLAFIAFAAANTTIDTVQIDLNNLIQGKIDAVVNGAGAGMLMNF